SGLLAWERGSQAWQARHRQCPSPNARPRPRPGAGPHLDARLRVRATLLPMMRHPIPRAAAGPLGWWYVFGSASLTLLLLQVLTASGVALVYGLSAERAYDSLLPLNYDGPRGWFLGALHYSAGWGWVVMVLTHMTRVFLHGA